MRFMTVILLRNTECDPRELRLANCFLPRTCKEAVDKGYLARKKCTLFHNDGRAERDQPLQNGSMTFRTFENHAVREVDKHPALQLKKILVPIDFSPASTRAFKYALRFAEEFAAELTLLYVLAPAPSRSFASIPGTPAFSESDLSGTEKNLRALIASTRNGSVQRVRSTMRIGVPSHEIVEMAKDADIDLIVIATHGYTGWKHFCIGSTAERVVRAARCPVLVVREKEHQFC
jgi:universal stress protein A